VPDTALFRLYQDLIALRRTNLRLFVDGAFHWLHTNDERGVLAYERVLGGQRALVAFNTSDTTREERFAVQGPYRAAWPAGETVVAGGEELRASLPPHSARVWIKE